jgi:environmental stress-induced protein Ves
MSFQILSADKRTTINWASGTSTEIFIYPPAASFADRNFLFRISTATVEAEESTFTFFQGITRHLMILKGELDLTHAARYSKHLRPFDQDTFSGEWSTRSKGKVTDFNLMLKGNTTGMLRHRSIKPRLDQSFTSKSSFYFVYFASGTALVNGIAVKSGDLAFIEKESIVTVRAEALCDIIEIEVQIDL